MLIVFKTVNFEYKIRVSNPWYYLLCVRKLHPLSSSLGFTDPLGGVCCTRNRSVNSPSTPLPVHCSNLLFQSVSSPLSLSQVGQPNYPRGLLSLLMATNSPLGDELTWRPLGVDDRLEIERLHLECFPVHYTAKFYDQVRLKRRGRDRSGVEERSALT
jgi:hypothetical protein